MSHIHIPDGVLPAWLWVLGWVVALLALTFASRVAERADVRRKVPLLAVASALMLVAMSSEIVPLAYHVNLTVIAGVLLGPALSVIAAFIAEIVLALLAHGGVTVIGLNTLIVATEMVVGSLLFRTLLHTLARERVRPAAFVATVLTLALSTSMLVGIVALSGGVGTARETGALDPTTLRFSSPFAHGVFSAGLFSGGANHAETPGARRPAHAVGRFAAVVFTLGSMGWILEGLLTGWVLGYIARVRPSLLSQAPMRRERLRPPGDEGMAG